VGVLQPWLVSPLQGLRWGSLRRKRWGFCICGVSHPWIPTFFGLPLQAVPEGDWFCPMCRCSLCGLSHFQADGFGDNTIIFCDQCTRQCELPSPASHPCIGCVPPF